MSNEQTPSSTSVQAAEAQPDEVNREPGGRRPGRFFLGFAVVPGILAWFVIQNTYPVFNLAPELANLAPDAGAAEEDALIAAVAEVNRHNAMLFIGLLGALVGGGCGAATRVARGSAGGALAGGFFGLAVGGLAGVAAACSGNLVYVLSKPTAGQPLPLTGTVIVQVVTLAVLGIGAGFAFGVAAGQRFGAFKGALAGCMAGVVAGLLYPMILGVFLPGAQSELAFPTDSPNQLLWIVVNCSILGLILPSTLSASGPRGLT